MLTGKWLKENDVRYIEVYARNAIVVSPDGSRWFDLQRPASDLMSFCDRNDIPWLHVNQTSDYSLVEYELNGSSERAMIMWFEDLCKSYPPQGYSTYLTASPRMKDGEWHAGARRYTTCD